MRELRLVLDAEFETIPLFAEANNRRESTTLPIALANRHRVGLKIGVGLLSEADEQVSRN